MKKLILILLLTLFSADFAEGAIYYIATTGAGSVCGPTSECALAILNTNKIQPGDTVFVRSGNYASQLPLTIDCSAGATSGSAGSPITVQAVNERGVVLNGNGGYTNLTIQNCSYWTISGFYSKSADNAGQLSDGQPLQILHSSHITITRWILSNNNRYCNCAILFVGYSNNNLFLENEFYYFHRHALSYYVSDFNVSVRNYFNSRGYADLPGCGVSGYCSATGDRGEAAVNVYPGSDNLSINDIGEGNLTLANVEAYGSGSNNRFLGDISIGDQFGALIKARSEGNTLAYMPQNTVLKNYLVINPLNVTGIALDANKNSRCDNCSVFGASLGIWAYTDGVAIGDGVYTTYVDNALVVAGSSPSEGIGMHNQNNFLVDYPLVFGYGGTAFVNGGGGSFTNTSTTDPVMGSCRVYVPPASAAYHSGKAGVSRGAEILYQYDTAGNLTTTPLWDFSQSGANRGQWIARGSTVAGVNDVAGSSLFDVHQRLGFGNGGCASPYGVIMTQVNWNIPSVPLVQDRVNTITITATDTNGQQYSTQVEIAYVNPGLVLALGMNEGAGTITADSSGFNNNGTFGSDVTWSNNGRYGKALHFDGTGPGITIPDSNSLDLTSGMTLLAFINPEATDPMQVVMSKGGSGGGYYFLFSTVDPSYCANNGYMGGISYIISYLACTPVSLPLNTWSYLAVTADGNTVNLYLNGNLTSSVPAAVFNRENSDPLQIGGSYFNEYFKGLIDEARIYNRALSQAEIVTAMNTAIGGVVVPSFTVKFPATFGARFGAGPNFPKFGAK